MRFHWTDYGWLSIHSHGAAEATGPSISMFCLLCCCVKYVKRHSVRTTMHACEDTTAAEAELERYSVLLGMQRVRRGWGPSGCITEDAGRRRWWSSPLIEILCLIYVIARWAPTRPPHAAPYFLNSVNTGYIELKASLISSRNCNRPIPNRSQHTQLAREDGDFD